MKTNNAIIENITFSTSITSIDNKVFYNAIANNERISASHFLPIGENSKGETKKASEWFTSYKSHFIDSVPLFEKYFNAYYSGNKSNATTYENKLVETLYKPYHLLGIELSTPCLQYIIKQVNACLHGIKSITDVDNVKHTAFTIGRLTDSRIRSAIEKALYNIITNGEYVDTTAYINNIYHNKDIASLVKKCEKLAINGKTKALNNHLDKLKTLVNDSTVYNALESDINSKLVIVEKPSSEKTLESVEKTA